MALLAFEGFEGLGNDSTNPPDDVVDRRYFFPSDSNDFYVVDGKLSGRAIRYADTGGYFNFYAGPDPSNISTDVTKIWGFSFYNQKYVDWDGNYFARFVSDTDHYSMGLKIWRNGTVVFYDHARNVLAVSEQGVCRPETWHDFEIKSTFHNTNGSVEIRVDGETVLSVTGVDTGATLGSYLRRVIIYSYQGVLKYAPYFDDFYCCDTAGSDHNDFLGSVRVLSNFPTADDTSDWTPSTGNDHYALVNENYPNDDTDYVSSNVVGAQDTFNVGTLSSSTSNIHGVKVGFDARAESGTKTIRQVLKSGSTEVYGDDNEFDSSWDFRNDYWLTDPDTGNAWTQNGYEAAKIGVELK